MGYVNKKGIFICLLLCCLLSSSFTGVLYVNGLNAYAGPADGSLSHDSDLSPVNGGICAAHAALSSIADCTLESVAASAQPSRWLQANKLAGIITVAVTLLTVALHCVSRLVQSFSVPFDSLGITIFLQAKDGSK
ncbi:MAG TPA: hypothetical protein VN441_03345 [Syntrophomonas sp.]|nr:hypothetical protein [Syntrophomonas sp.]